MAEQRALVIGCGIAGLMAATVLSRHFAEVVIIERDHLDDLGLGPRSGVPQGQHLHVLHQPGRAKLEELYPGICAELEAGGAVWFDPADQLYWHLGGGRASGRGVQGEGFVLSQSRPFLEQTVRNRVRATPNITLRADTRVTGIDFVRHQSENTLVRVATTDSDQDIEVRLVIDASGRLSRLDRWLADAGFGKPEEQLVNIGVRYATMLLSRPVDPTFLAYAIQPEPPYVTRGASMFPIEDGRWILTLAGWSGDRPSADPEGFESFLRSLSTHELAEEVSGLEPLEEVRTFSFPASRRTLYSSMPSFPIGVVPLGDAICSLNPVYGQGMTSAAAQIGVLQERLASGVDRFDTGQFLEEAEAATKDAWLVAAVGDHQFPATSGWRPSYLGLSARYMQKVALACHADARVSLELSRVLAMEKPVGSIAHPAVVARVAFAAVARRRFA